MVAGVLGVLLLGAAFGLRAGLSRTTFDSNLLAHLPADSRTVGLARLDVTTPDLVSQITKSTNQQPALADVLKDTLGRAGVSTGQLRAAFDDRFAFADTPRGGLAVFTIKNVAKAKEVGGALRNQLADPNSSPHDDVAVTTGRIAERQIAVAQDGSTVYVAANPELIDAARKESNGFTTIERFNDVQQKLPGNADGFLFFNSAVSTGGPAGNLPLIGLSWDDAKDNVDINAATSTNSQVTQFPAKTNGDVLVPAELAPFSVQAASVNDIIATLEEQRQEQDVPSVIRLQTGLAALSRTLGIDLQKEYLASADQGAVYARYINENGPQWMGAAGFKDSAMASTKTDALVRALAAKATVPVRKEIVRVLPDGTQSREIVSEGRQAVTFNNLEIEGRTVQSTILPGGVGGVYFLNVDKYFVVGSSPDAVARMIKVVTGPRQGYNHSGELAVRLKVANAAQILNDPDLFGRWLYAARPSTGRFTLDKQSGVLTGTVEFAGNV